MKARPNLQLARCLIVLVGIFSFAIGPWCGKGAEKPNPIRLNLKIIETLSDGTRKVIAEPILFVEEGRWAAVNDQVSSYYPTSYLPPSVPESLVDSVESSRPSGSKERWTTNETRMLIPAQPEDFEIKTTGYEIRLRPRLMDSGDIHVDCEIEHIILEGLNRASSPITLPLKATLTGTKHLTLAENKQEVPVFHHLHQKQVFEPVDGVWFATSVTKDTFRDPDLAVGAGSRPISQIEVELEPEISETTPQGAHDGKDNAPTEIDITVKVLESEDLLPVPNAIMSPEELQWWIREISKKPSVDIVAAPKIRAKPGQRGKIEVVREFIYPSSYTPPKLPGAAQIKINHPEIFPATPATPVDFESANLGITLDLITHVLPSGMIRLDAKPQVSQFDRFINYGERMVRVEEGISSKRDLIVISENRIEMPVFSVRGFKSIVDLPTGSTVILAGLQRLDTQQVEEKIPILGDLPVVGGVGRSSRTEVITRHLYFAITTKAVLE
ncbi:MAG: hypothetical protein AAGA96_03230 [Verrucomicrobiota bacterium]